VHLKSAKKAEKPMNIAVKIANSTLSIASLSTIPETRPVAASKP
jgi:hypothetical protein